MLEELFNILKSDCKIFDLQYIKDKYRLILDEEKAFTGDTVEEVLNEAVDWLDSRDNYLDSNISLTGEMYKNGIPEGFKDYGGNDNNENFEPDDINQSAIYKIAGYESDGRE